MSKAMSDATPTLDDRVTAFHGEDDHFLRHVVPTETTFSGRHQRHIDTTVTDTGLVVHTVIESYDSDAHGDSLSWKYGIPTGSCPVCSAGELDTELDRSDAQVTETSTCDTCPFMVRQASINAEYDDPDYQKPKFYRANVPHNFEDEPDIAWEDHKEQTDDADIPDLANIVRTLSLQKFVGRVRDKAYDSDKKAIQTDTCEHCEATVESPAVKTHPYYGTVCPDCEDISVWTVEDAELPDDVVEQMETHASFNSHKITALLRDVIYYANYQRTRLDADSETDPEDIPEGITTGEGGQIDAQGLGRGKKGTGLRRPDGPFHNNAHWRTLLSDAKETDLITRSDSTDCDDDHEDARWVATEKGKDVFTELARCQTCGNTKDPYYRTRVYQTQGKHTNKDSSLTLACADCDQMESKPSGMTIASSSGETVLRQLNGVQYE